MAKKIAEKFKMMIPAGQANPSPPVGPALGQRGVNIMEFCKAFNEKSKDKMGFKIPVVVTVYTDKSFTMELKLPPASDLILKEAGIKISMDGKGAWRDNVFVERLWRTIKYEEVYLHAYENVPQARAGIEKYLRFYNEKRPHSSLDRQTPDQVYFNPLQPIPVAA